MRASRLLSIQMLLQAHGRMSATALARALDVSVRTLHRDIDELTSAGVPVYAERGRAGGFQLLPGWKTSLTGFTPEEAEAVFLAGLAGPASDLGLGPQVASAERKLLAALPAPWRGGAHRLRSRLHLDPVEWYREAEPVPFLPVVAHAVWEERQLAMSYESWSRTARRIVHPLGLVMKAGTWYFVAAREGKVRTWRVASVLDAQLADAPVQRPRGFDLAESWQASVRRFEVELFTGEALVAATARAHGAAAHQCGAGACSGGGHRAGGRRAGRTPHPHRVRPACRGPVAAAVPRGGSARPARAVRCHQGTRARRGGDVRRAASVTVRRCARRAPGARVAARRPGCAPPR